MTRARRSRRREFLTTLAASSLAPLAACTPASRPDKPHGPMPAPSRPTLLITAADIARTRALIARDPLCASWYRAVRDEAERILATEPVTRTYEARRTVMLQASRTVLHRVRTLGGLWLLTGDARYATRAKAELAAAARFQDWNPRHFLDTAEMAHAFSLGLDWFDAALSPAERTELTAALIEKGIEPGLAAYAGEARWTRWTNNWNLVCNGGLVLAALAIERTDPERSRLVLERALESARHGFDSYAPDGGWIEGPMYWSYATHYAAFLIAGLESLRGPSAFAETPGFSETGLFGLHTTGPTTRVFNYADCSPENYTGAYMFWLSRRFDRPVYADFYRRHVGEEPNILDLLWYDPRTCSPDDAGIPTAAHFRRIAVACMRGSWQDPKTTWVAIKGGYNGASHAHLDLGTFVLEAGGARFAVDLGGDDYALPGYWTWAQRATYYRLGSRGHNLCMPADVNQVPTAHAEIVAFGSDPNDSYAIVGLDAAWPDHGRAKRGVRLVGGRHVVIADEVERSVAAPWLWQMHTRAAVEIDGPQARLTEAGARLFLHVLEPAGATFAVEPVEIPAPQQPTRGERRLVIRLPAGQGRMRVAVVATPAPAPSPAALAAARVPLEGWRTSSRAVAT